MIPSLPLKHIMPKGMLVSSSLYLLTLCIPLATAVSPKTDPNFWKIEIWNGPAPSPEDGPPGARNADRNKAHLPGEICGIVGAYLLSIVIIGTALLTVGRRKRMEALNMASSPKEVEMVKSAGRIDPAMPKSPGGSTKSWIKNHLPPLRSPRKSSQQMEIGSPTSPGVASVTSFDANVVENDKVKAAAEMENLYAAVMAYDARKSQQSVVTTEIPEPNSPLKPVNKNLLRIATGNPAKGPVGPSPISPVSPSYPSHVRPVYPSDKLPYGAASPLSPTSSIPPGSPGAPPSPLFAGGLYPAAKPPTGISAHVSSRPQTQGSEPPVSPRSQRSFFGRTSRAESVSSSTSKGSKGRRPPALANLRISKPYTSHGEDDTAPLTPTTYNNVPRPPSPPTEPPTPETGNSINQPATSQYGYLDPEAQEAYEAIDEPAPLPRPAPQRGASHPSNLTLQMPPNANRSSENLPKSASSSHTELPLRATHNPGNPTTKTTYLERKKDQISGLNPGSALRTATTPYSPYMPFTPMTPVTPHLVTKAERKIRKKEEKYRGRLAEDDQVIAEDDMWGSAY